MHRVTGSVCFLKRVAYILYIINLQNCNPVSEYEKHVI